MFDPKHLHVMIASDSNYAEFVSVVLASLFANNRKEFEKITVHLFSNGIESDIVEKIKLTFFDGIGELAIYNIHDIATRLGVNTAGETMPISSYARLLLTEYVDLDISRMLYVDCDVVINGSLLGMWSIPMGRYLIAGTLDAHMDAKPKTEIGMAEDAPYVNGGVLLINLDEWRKVDIVGKFKAFIRRYNGNVYHQDQGLINGVCQGRIKVLGPECNMTSFFFSHPFKILARFNKPFYTQEELCIARSHPLILHFTEGFLGRPWMKHCKHPFAGIFLKYHRATPWRDVPLREDNRSLPLRVTSWLFLNLPYSVYCATGRFINFLKKAQKSC